MALLTYLHPGDLSLSNLIDAVLLPAFIFVLFLGVPVAVLTLAVLHARKTRRDRLPKN